MKTIGELVRWRALLEPDEVAIHFEGRDTTYKQLDLQSNRVANALVAAGVRPGQRACVLDKGHDAFFAVAGRKNKPRFPDHRYVRL